MLGQAAHAVLAEATRTLLRVGDEPDPRGRHRQIDTQEMIEIMYEIVAEHGYALPADEREELRWLCLRFCNYPWYPQRLLAIEEQLAADIVCQDGVTRRITGRPDMIFADPPHGLVIPDFKSTRAVPRTPRNNGDDETIVGREYLSLEGHYQLDVYGLLALNAYPVAQYVILREFHLRSGKVREARLERHEAEEHVYREIGIQLMLLDRALSEGEASPQWRPRPGRHCVRACPVALSCPIPAEQRGVGQLTSDDDADAMAARYAVVDAVRKQMREKLKTYHEETGYCPQVGDGHVVRWKTNRTGSRSFDIHWPDDNIVGDA
jgi:hypothetical protein